MPKKKTSSDPAAMIECPCHCYFQESVREVHDILVAETIVRKGGVIIPPPPKYDPMTQRAPVYDGSEWVIEKLTPQEIAAAAEAATAEAERVAIKKLTNDFAKGKASNENVQRALAHLTSRL